MKAFSIESALTAGFRLIKREPLAVLMWGVAYIVIMIVIEAIAMGPALAAVLQGLLSDPQNVSAAMEQATGANTVLMLPLIVPISIAAYAMLYSAIARAELHPEDRKFFFLRLSKRELWVALSYLVLAVLAIVVLIAICIPVALAARAASGGQAPAVYGWGVLFGLPALAGILYLGGRMSMTWLIAFDEGRFVLFDSWRLTEGQGWRLVLLALALMLLVIIASIGVALTVLVGGIIMAFVAKSAGAFGVVLGVLAIVMAIAMYVALFGAMYSVLLAPYIEAYRGLRAARAAEPA